MATVFDENFWDERYGSSGAVWSGKPNPQLVAEVSWLTSAELPEHRTALDVGCGEGADSVWLAGQGWHVSAVDISRVALQRAEAHATGLVLPGSIVWERRDLLSWTPPVLAFDLVTAQFMHLLREDRELAYARLAASVAPGGTLLIVGHSPSDALAGARRPDVPALFFTAVDVAASLDPGNWRVEVAQARPRNATGNEGKAITVHDEVMRAVRLA